MALQKNPCKRSHSQSNEASKQLEYSTVEVQTPSLLNKLLSLNKSTHSCNYSSTELANILFNQIITFNSVYSTINLSTDTHPVMLIYDNYLINTEFNHCYLSYLYEYITKQDMKDYESSKLFTKCSLIYFINCQTIDYFSVILFKIYLFKIHSASITNIDILDNYDKLLPLYREQITIVLSIIYHKINKSTHTYDQVDNYIQSQFKYPNYFVYCTLSILFSQLLISFKNYIPSDNYLIIISLMKTMMISIPPGQLTDTTTPGIYIAFNSLLLGIHIALQRIYNFSVHVTGINVGHITSIHGQSIRDYLPVTNQKSIDISKEIKSLPFKAFPFKTNSKDTSAVMTVKLSEYM